MHYVAVSSTKGAYSFPGIAFKPASERAAIMARVREFTEFSPHNDPFGEYDYGSFEHAGETIMWKIDYFNSPNPAD